MRDLSEISGFSSLKDRILLRVSGKEGGAAALRYAREAEEGDRGRILALCDGEAEEYIGSAGGYVPDAVNVYRAAAFSLVWKYAPAYYSHTLFTGEKGREVVVAFYGVDGYTAEIFKALASTYLETVRTKGGVRADKVRYIFFADEKEREELKKLPYLAAVKALADAAGKPGYYELPEQLAAIEIRERGEDVGYGGAFVWAVAAGGVQEAAEVEAGLEKKGVPHAVFCPGDGSVNDGIYTFGTSEECVSFYLKILLIALARDMIYGAAAGGNVGSMLAGQLEKWKQASSRKVKRDSNLYAALALRGLMLSLGFDCGENAESATDAFNALYDGEEPRVINADGTVYYDNALGAGNSLRAALAFREHLRWNEYMFACGVGPASKKDHIIRDKNELLSEGRHINVTTWKGLEDFRADEAKRKGTDEESTDVQRYDFQLADGAADMLAAAGYVITKMQGRER